MQFGVFSELTECPRQVRFYIPMQELLRFTDIIPAIQYDVLIMIFCITPPLQPAKYLVPRL